MYKIIFLEDFCFLEEGNGKENIIFFVFFSKKNFRGKLEKRYILTILSDFLFIWGISLGIMLGDIVRDNVGEIIGEIII